MGHTKASWFLRSHPRVTKAFETIWETTKLLTRFDTFIAWRPWKMDPKTEKIWRPVVENLHIDQNPFHKRGRQAVQGMIPLFPVNSDIGGLQVIPKSHIDGTDSKQELVRQIYAYHEHHNNDWIEFNKRDYAEFGTGQLVKADPGDLILWDSRLIHGGHVGSGLVQPGKEHQIIRGRIKAFNDQACTSHWPH